MSRAIDIEDRGDVLIVRFARPEKRNPLSSPVVDEIRSIVAEAEADEKRVRIIFTGTDGVFASGADLREIMRIDPKGARDFARRGQSLMSAIANARCKTVAAVNGLCFGGALDLALACDLRIASPSAEFAHPGAKLGIITGWGGTQRLPALIGRGRALEMFMTARRVGADEALRHGLIDEVAGDPVERALSVEMKPAPHNAA